MASIIKFRVNAAELAAIREAAGGQPVASFVRGKALARAGGDDVDYEMGIIRELAQVVEAMRGVQTAMRETGIEPAESVWHPIMDALQKATDKVQVL